MKEPALEKLCAEMEADALVDLIEVGKALTATAELESVLHLIMEKVQGRIEAKNWSLLLKDPSTGGLRFHIARGLDQEKIGGMALAPGEGVAGVTAQTGEAMFVEDVAKDPRFSPRVDGITGFQTKSIVCLPLIFDRQVLGVIEVVNLADFQGFVKNKIPYLKVLADYAAIAIHNASLIAELHRMTITDSLTALYNDRFLYKYLHHELDMARDAKTPYSLVFLDLDDFKTVVDTHGHLAGSQTLKLFGGFIRKELPSQFAIVRFGGDEFVILLPGVSREQAIGVVENLRQAIARETFAPDEQIKVRLSASFGVAGFPDDAGDLRELLARADEAMYRAKRGGKGQIAT
jgi:diguanylate cyclase (GGDEF)-like protein